MRLSEYPRKGKFGSYGGSYVPEILIPALTALEKVYLEIKEDKEFKKALDEYNRDYGGRPTPLYLARRLTKKFRGAKIYLKREDLVHGGAHKFNNVMGQALLAKKLGKERIICETGAGQHGVACALAGAVLGTHTEAYMGAIDAKRQQPNLFRMKLLGAKVNIVKSGSRTLKDAINEALRDWATNLKNTYYLIGSVVGPHPYPMIVRDFQRIIGDEIKDQILAVEDRLPDFLVACVGGGSNAMGTFYPFVEDKEMEFLGVEAGGSGKGKNAASLVDGEIGVLHGTKSYLLQDRWGQVGETESIAPGLDYPGVGPEHALYKETGRAKYTTVSDNQALEGFKILSETEGIIPALESAHAVYAGLKLAGKLSSEKIVVITVSGRGDKDLDTVKSFLDGYGQD